MSQSFENTAERISRVVFDYASRITGERDTGKLLLLNADLARDLTNADRCSIWLVDEKAGQLWTKVAHGAGEIRIAAGHGVVGDCIARNEAILVNDTSTDARFNKDVDKSSGYITESIVTLPLRAATGKVLGALQVLNKPGGFTMDDVQILGLAGSYAASVLEGQRLREEAETARLMYHELEIARNVQQKLLPQNIPYIQGIAYDGSCRPAKFVGGDYYDILPLQDGCVAFTLGDVSGKGIAAAMLMASVQATLRGLMLRRPESLAELVTDLNKTVYASSTSDKYTTLFCGVIDASRRKLTYVNAAQVTPLLVRGGVIHKLAESNMPVGMFGNTTFEQAVVDLEPGDLIVCFSDGISECSNTYDEFWDEADIEREVASATGPEIVAQLFLRGDAFADGADQFDDMTVIAVKLT